MKRGTVIKRNWYAVLILIALSLALLGCRHYVHTTAQGLQQEVQQAYACTLRQDYAAAQQAFSEAEAHARQASKVLGLVVRRTALERVNETMAVLSSYANPDNQADLSVETARACAQIRQMEKSFLGTF